MKALNLCICVMLLGGKAISQTKTKSLSTSRPNIIFILSDDTGWGEI